MATTDERLTSLESKFEMFVDEMRDFKIEMRDRDNQRANEIQELRQKHDADIKEINARIESKFDKLSSQIQNLTIAAVVEIGAIVIGGGAIIWSAISSLK